MSRQVELGRQPGHLDGYRNGRRVSDFPADDDRAGVNQFLLQPFINYNFPCKPGRYVCFSPVITADWILRLQVVFLFPNK